MVRRAGDGTWGLPGGGVETGETWAGAAMRECREETGWEVETCGLLGVYSEPGTQIYRYPDGRLVHFFRVVFLGKPLCLTGSRDGEASEVGWFPLDRLPEPIFSADLPVLQDAADRLGRPFIR